MARLEFAGVELKLLQGFGALVMVPGVGEQHAADVPKNGANRWQSVSPCNEGLRKSVEEIASGVGRFGDRTGAELPERDDAEDHQVGKQQRGHRRRAIDEIVEGVNGRAAE